MHKAGNQESSTCLASGQCIQAHLVKNMSRAFIYDKRHSLSWAETMW